MISLVKNKTRKKKKRKKKPKQCIRQKSWVETEILILLFGMMKAMKNTILMFWARD